MGQPEMSYAPARYYQASDQFFPAYQPPPSVPAAYYSPPDLSLPRHPPGGVPHRHPPESSSAKDHTHHPSDSSVAQYNRHSLSQPSRPQSEQRPLAPASAPCVTSPSPHNSLSTGASNSSGAATAAKEGRIRGSWTDHSSYMSNENHLPHGVSRVHKQTFPDDDGAEDGPDGLLMLVGFPSSRRCIQIDKTNLSYIVPPLNSRSHLLHRRVYLRHLRRLLRPPYLASPALLHNSPLCNHPHPTLHPPSASPPHPRTPRLSPTPKKWPLPFNTGNLLQRVLPLPVGRSRSNRHLLRLRTHRRVASLLLPQHRPAPAYLGPGVFLDLHCDTGESGRNGEKGRWPGCCTRRYEMVAEVAGVC